ncbi:hypothetical protein Pmani_033587 [Petrolisthes manimaculis]|uniref:Uncharacterized protein n=1 Tax=Petrolisthes manimaculis TaxID=1843537 RepID=A0AAE1NR97_9EUCA|nr:hypothetical protein Pmani_033587 [Petrolisthes manimaculis]
MDIDAGVLYTDTTYVQKFGNHLRQPVYICTVSLTNGSAVFIMYYVTVYKGSGGRYEDNGVYSHSRGSLTSL